MKWYLVIVITVCVCSIAAGFTLVFTAVTPEREAGMYYKEGNCTISFATSNVCLYKIPGFENNWMSLSCDIMMPRLSLAQYNANSFTCYYRTVKNVWGNDITEGDVLFEKPKTPDLMMMTGFIMVIVSVICLFVLFVWVRCKELQKQQINF